MREKAHGGHVGIEGCIRRLKESLFWPGMVADAKTYFGQCDVCLSVQDAPRKEPLLQYPLATRPWAMVAADICEFDGRSLLIVVDYFSNFIEVSRLNSLSCNAVVRVLKELFARWGAPDTLVTDNGKQFDSSEFRLFAKEWAFQHVTSSPHYPQSGQSEFRALLDWRNTPSEGFDSSPAQRMMGRRCKTTLPCHRSLLQPKYDINNDVSALRQRKQQQAAYYNRTATPRASLHSGETVRIQRPGCSNWSPGVCVREVSPRSYDIQVGDVTYRRNRRSIRASGQMLKRNNSHVPLDESSVSDEEHQEPQTPETGGDKPPETQQTPATGMDQVPIAGNTPTGQLRRSTRSVRPPVRFGFEEREM